MAAGNFAVTTSNQYISGLLWWTATSNGSAANSSTVTVDFRLERTNTGFTTQGTANVTITINGTNFTSSQNVVLQYQSNTQCAYVGSVIVPHNADGSKICSITVSGTVHTYTINTSGGNAVFDTIPRYAAFNSASCTSTGLTSASFSWSTNSNVDWVRAYLNGSGSHVDWSNLIASPASSGSYTWSGLAANTSYTVVIEVKRADSQLWTRSGSISFTTKAPSYITSTTTAPVLGRDISYSLANPSGASTEIQVFVLHSDNLWYSYVHRQTNVATSGTLTLSSVKAALYDGAINRNKTAYLLRVNTAGYLVDYVVNNVSIPASTPTISNFTMGNTTTINISRDDANLTHVVSYSFGSASNTISSNATTSASWATSLSGLAAQVPNGTSGTGTITCKTYHGTALVGTKTVNFTASVPTSVVPSFTSLTHAEQTTGVTSVINKYIKGVSNIKFTINGAAGIYGSTISAYTVNYRGSNKSGQTYTTGTIDWSGDQTVTATITDSRGRTASKSVTINALNYANPSISTFTMERCLPDGTIDELGENIKLVRSGTASSLLDGTTEKNTITAKVFYKLTSSSTWTQVSTSGVAVTDSTNVSGAVASTEYVLLSFPATNSYDFKFELSDKFKTTTLTRVVSTGAVPMSLSATGVGVGKIWQQGALDVKGDAFVEGALGVKGAVYVSDGNLLMDNNANIVPSAFTRLTNWANQLNGKPYSWNIHLDASGNAILGYTNDTGAMSSYTLNHAHPYASNAISITAGNGLSGGGTLAATRTITLGTPGTCTASTSNAVTSTSHTHNITGYLPLTGGTLTGTLNTKGIVFADGNFPQTYIASGAGVNANTLVGSGYRGTKYFLINSANVPWGHGMIEVFYYNGAGFAPRGQGAMKVTIQRYTNYDGGNIHTRAYLDDDGTPYWTSWAPYR